MIGILYKAWSKSRLFDNPARPQAQMIHAIIRAFGLGHIGRYRQPGEDTTNFRYRNVILTNALDGIHPLYRNVCLY